ncbi:hypothetical protein [Paenibacillus planticolens]|uniref:Lipoprotein n=1 Tax=Paenibacillus planticolens TaxID=2654976 RepID=A0ABX1ZML4_9BACL|nr:hypothetical protein [Paenibacillus planticolens]NOV01317.1 hypothetical protein [Paenibacillus planticolens]
MRFIKFAVVPVALALLVLSAAACGTNDKAAVSSSSSAAPSLSPEEKAKIEAEAKAKVEAEVRAKAEADAKTKAEADAKAKAEAEAKTKAAADVAKNPNWNKSEVDALKNGNLPLAVNMIKAIKETPAGEKISPETVIKTPWTYYGKAISFTGNVGVVDDYPPDSDFGKAGLAAEIVIECEDGTIVDFFSMTPSGKMKIGEDVTITGYVVGRTEVENKLGGKFTHLIAVTNKLN